MTVDGRPDGKRTRRRGDQLEHDLLDAAWTELLERGYDGLTFEAVAARAGTSRPVLYRRWRDRRELALAALRAHWTPVPVPDTGSLREDAIAFLTALSSSRAELLSVLDTRMRDLFTTSDATPASVRGALHVDDRPEPMQQMLGRAVQRGEIPERDRSHRQVRLPFDLVRHEMLLSREPVPASTIAEIVDTIWIPVLRHR